MHEKPRIREATPKSWWGEMVWNPSLFQHSTCQDVSLTSDSQPGTATVCLRLSSLLCELVLQPFALCAQLLWRCSCLILGQSFGTGAVRDGHVRRYKAVC